MKIFPIIDKSAPDALCGVVFVCLLRVGFLSTYDPFCSFSVTPLLLISRHHSCTAVNENFLRGTVMEYERGDTRLL